MLVHYPREFQGTYLAFGNDTLSLADALLGRGWKGVTVLPFGSAQGRFHKNEITIEAQVGQDARFVRLIGSAWTRTVTIDEIFLQFDGPYDLIAAVNTSRDRETWRHPCVFNAIPKVYVLGEDGHNEETVKTAFDRGYFACIAEERLVLIHE